MGTKSKVTLYNISEFDKEAVCKFLLSKENVEDIETSFFGDKIR